MKKIFIIVLISFFLAGCSRQELIQLKKDKELYITTNTQLREENQTLKNEISVLKSKLDVFKEQDERYIKEESGIFLKQEAYSHIVFNNQLADIDAGQKIDVDISTFEFLSGGFAKDNNKIYFKGFGLDNIDTNSFEIINDKYAKDKNYVIQIYGDDLFIISDNPINFKINDQKKTKKVSIDCLSKKITIPDNRKIENKKTKDNKNISCYYNINTNLNLYLITGDKTEKYPIYFYFSILKEGDSFEDGTIIDDFYNLTSEDKEKINNGEFTYFIYEGTWNRYYAIKIGNVSYRFSVDALSDIISDLDDNPAFDYGMPMLFWDLFEKEIEESILSLRS